MSEKERIYSLSEIIDGIDLHEILEGTLFVNTIGEHAVVDHGGLQWYESKNYVGTPVTVTAETINDYWKMAELHQDAVLTFIEALPLINEGRTVTLTTAQGINYTVRSLTEVGNLITYNESLEDVYQSTCITYKTVTVKKPEPKPGNAPTRGVSNRKGRIHGAVDKSQRKGQKLSQEDVTAIRAHFRHGVHSLELADRYGVSQRMIHYIVKGQSWSNTQ